MKWITEQREETASWPKPNRPTDFAVWPPEDNMTGLDLKQAMGAFFYGGGGVGDMESPITDRKFVVVDDEAGNDADDDLTDPGVAAEPATANTPLSDFDDRQMAQLLQRLGAVTTTRPGNHDNKDQGGPGSPNFWNHIKQMHFQQPHNQGLCQLFLTVSSDLRA